LHKPLLRAIEQLSQVFRDPDSLHHLNEATEAAISREYYQALKALRGLLAREARLLSAHQA